MNVIDTVQWVPTPLAQVFPFFAQPENLGELTPPQMRFQILTPPPLTMKEGALIDYRISLGPLPMRWRTLITHYDPPHMFVDEQLQGPYDLWHHRHRFTEKDGGTEIRDTVTYRMPFGPLGDVVHALAVRRQLAGIFAYREKRVAELFG